MVGSALTFWWREGHFGRHELNEGQVAEAVTRMHASSSMEAVCGRRMRDKGVLAEDLETGFPAA